MSISDFVGDIFNDAQAYLAEVMATGFFQVNRPNYASSSTTEATIIASIGGSLDQGGGTYAKPRYSGVEYYVPSFDRDWFQEGDVIIPLAPAALSTPIVTVQNAESKHTAVAFRSSKVCSLTTAINKVQFSNVRYDIFSVTNSESPITSDMEGAPEQDTQKIIFWQRPEVRIGWRIQDSTSDRVWTIHQITGTGNIMEALVVEQ